MSSIGSLDNLVSAKSSQEDILATYRSRTSFTKASSLRESLAVVHLAFARIVFDDAVYHNMLFPVAKPAILSAKPTSCLCGAGWEIEP